MIVPSFSYELEGLFVLQTNIMFFFCKCIYLYHTLCFAFVTDDTELESCYLLQELLDHWPTISVLVFLDVQSPHMGTNLSLEPGIFSLKNQLLRFKFTNVCRMEALQSTNSG